MSLCEICARPIVFEDKWTHVDGFKGNHKISPAAQRVTKNVHPHNQQSDTPVSQSTHPQQKPPTPRKPTVSTATKTRPTNNTNTKPEVNTQTITPGLAKKWLDTTNTSNRRLRLRKIKQYADMMRRGQWMSEGDTYRFDVNGVLLDGQHRLAAVVESGHTVRNAVIITNLPPETFKVLDSGMLRSPGDALGPDTKAATHKASAIRLLYVVEIVEEDPRLSEPRVAVTRTDLADYYNDYTEDVDHGYRIGDKLYNTVRGNRSAWIAFAVLANRASENHAEEFFEAVLSGANLAKNDPRLALRNWLLNKRKLPNAGAHLGILIKTWNAWMEGKTRVSIMFRDEETFPKMVTRKALVLP